MAEGEGSKEPVVPGKTPAVNGKLKDLTTGNLNNNEDDGEDEEEGEEEEPRLKYATVTKRLNSVFRNGDGVSAFLVSGDKMVCIIAINQMARSDSSLTNYL